MRKGSPQRCHWIHFLLDIHYWECSLPLRVLCLPSESLLEKTNFLLASGYQLEIASGLGWSVCPLLLLALGLWHLVQTHAGPSHAASVSEWQSCWFREPWCFGGSPSPLALLLFLPPLLQGSLSIEGRDLIEISSLRLNVSRSLILCIMFVSLYIWFHPLVRWSRGKFLWWWLSKVSTVECH